VGRGTAISIHIYGTDVSRIGSSVRLYYDLPVSSSSRSPPRATRHDATIAACPIVTSSLSRVRAAKCITVAELLLRWLSVICGPHLRSTKGKLTVFSGAGCGSLARAATNCGLHRSRAPVGGPA